MNVSKIYGHGDSEVRALDDVTIQFEKGHFTAIMGPSGSGKSTLMHCMAGLDSLTTGSVAINGIDLRGLSDKALTKLRRDQIGFVFQAFNLIPTLNAKENIVLPLSLGGQKGDDVWIDKIIDTIGLRDRLTHRPSELSGGQQQRVAVARALINRPKMILADEPSGNLDTRNAESLHQLFFDLAEYEQQGFLIVTHNEELAKRSHRNIELRDGRVFGE
jgi:putative ABC transport system ATP-binding protein